jgi:membrane-associated PAP2 superfamily phosphatase
MANEPRSAGDPDLSRRQVLKYSGLAAAGVAGSSLLAACGGGGSDGGSGGCFPAGHASTGFAFLGGYFAYRGSEPGRARAWLVGGLTAGLVLGLTQQMRGAHFMSHTLWSGWVCWCVAWGIDAVARRIRDRRTPACGAVAHAAGTAPPAAAGGR